MIQLLTRLRCIDNTGARIVKCIGVLKPHKRSWARAGEIIVGTVRDVRPSDGKGDMSSGAGGSDDKSKVQRPKKGEVVHALVVRTRAPTMRKDGTWTRFSDNACVLVHGVKNKKTGIMPRGTRVAGVVQEEIRKVKLLKVAAICSHFI